MIYYDIILWTLILLVIFKSNRFLSILGFSLYASGHPGVGIGNYNAYESDGNNKVRGVVEIVELKRKLEIMEEFIRK